jgi:putative NIF3 family GTP cyclohydrolase 1 type 2
LRLDQAARRVMTLLRADGLHRVGEPDRRIERIAVACGAAGTFLASARRARCELLVTGETNFHTCLEAEATGVCLLLPGHFASERFAVEQLADVLDQAFSHLTVWAARDEHDPLQWVGSA